MFKHNLTKSLTKLISSQNSFLDCDACEDMKKCTKIDLTYELCQTNRDIERSCPQSCCAKSSLEGYINILGSPKNLSV